MKGQTIRHMVLFNLKYEANSPKTERFLSDGREILSSIPVVQGFEVLRQISPKNNYHLGFSMEFADQQAYDSYNNHPKHIDFVKSRWESEVAEFLEIDFKAL